MIISWLEWYCTHTHCTCTLLLIKYILKSKGFVYFKPSYSFDLVNLRNVLFFIMSRSALHLLAAELQHSLSKGKAHCAKLSFSFCIAYPTVQYWISPGNLLMIPPLSLSTAVNKLCLKFCRQMLICQVYASFLK